jgi:Flp pilus assembly protein TadB
MGIASELLGLLAAGGLLAAFFYWTTQGPERARQRRLQALDLNRSHHQPWDADIGARRRER